MPSPPGSVYRNPPRETDKQTFGLRHRARVGSHREHTRPTLLDLSAVNHRWFPRFRKNPLFSDPPEPASRPILSGSGTCHRLSPGGSGFYAPGVFQHIADTDLEGESFGRRSPEPVPRELEHTCR